MKFYEKCIACYITMETKITIRSNVDLYQLLVVSLWLILFVSFLDCVGQWLLVFLNTAFFMDYLLISYVQVTVCG